MKTICTSFLLGVIFLNLHAQVTVSTQTELEDAITNVQSGHTIILSNGIWEDVEIKLNAFADENNPITIKAESAGQVIFEGRSIILIGGSHIHIEGIVFTNPSDLISDNNRIDPIIKFKNPQIVTIAKSAILKSRIITARPLKSQILFIGSSLMVNTMR